MKNIRPCLFCQSEHNSESVEHIVPRKLGNIHYILPKGVVCARCNNKFGLIEQRVLSSTPILEERARLGLLKALNPKISNELDQADWKAFLVKMAVESLYQSSRRIWERYDFSDLRESLMRGIVNNTIISRAEYLDLLVSLFTG